MDKSTAIITAITGNWFNLNESTKGFDSYVLSTRSGDEFKQHAKEKGWELITLDKPHTENLSDASIQAKDVKFLNFNRSKLEKYEYILYHDHKYYFNQNQINILKENLNDKYIAAGEDSFSVFIEYFRCMFYERYKVVEHKIRNNIDLFTQNHGLVPPMIRTRWPSSSSLPASAINVSPGFKPETVSIQPSCW